MHGFGVVPRISRVLRKIIISFHRFCDRAGVWDIFWPLASTLASMAHLRRAWWPLPRESQSHLKSMPSPPQIASITQPSDRQSGMHVEMEMHVFVYRLMLIPLRKTMPEEVLLIRVHSFRTRVRRRWQHSKGFLLEARLP